MPSPNSGIALAPGRKWTVVAMDDQLGSNYQIWWFDKYNNNFSSNSGVGMDPDVAFSQNSDLTYITYNHSGTIWIDTYVLTIPFGSPNYLKQSADFLGAGTYPNLDINSSGDGVVCFQSGGNTVVRAFSPHPIAPILYPPVIVGVGTQPDVILSDNGIDVIVTSIDGGNLNVTKLNYADLILGSLSTSLVQTHPASGENYSFPRIASPRNKNFMNINDFTVVAERATTSGQRIEGFNYSSSGSVTNFLVNDGLDHCENNKPVVTYDGNRLVFAWTSKYDAVCAPTITSKNNQKEDVLMAEYTATTLRPLSGGAFAEVNQTQGAFNQSNVSITCRYDGNHTISATKDLGEAATFTNNNEAFWKSRTYGTAYKMHSETQDGTELSESFSITLLENPVLDVIRLQLEEANNIQVSVRDVTGKTIDLSKRMQASSTHINIDMRGLSSGLYFVSCHTIDGQQKVFKVIYD